MQLPSQLEQRRFLEWNYLVKGLMQVWEVARLLKMEAHLEQQLQNDTDGALTDRLAYIGDQLSPVFDYLRICGYLQQDMLVVHQALNISSASTQAAPAIKAMTAALSFFDETPHTLLLIVRLRRSAKSWYEGDEVALVKTRIKAGTVVVLPGGTEVRINLSVPPGHKFALIWVEEGIPMRKYSQVIGYATRL